MSLFPFMKSVDEKQIVKPYKEYEFNFQTNQLTGKLLEGKEALRVWIQKTLQTKRYAHTIYSWDYGQDLDELIGQGYEKGFIDSEVERRIKECLLINPHIIDCINFTINHINDQLSVDFTVITTYGEIEINV